MKQSIKIALLLLYVFFNAGLSYSMHFCEEDFKRINLFAEAKTCCESNEPMPGCCDDVSNLELPNTDQQISDLLGFQPLMAGFPATVLQFELPLFFFSTEKTAFTDSSPPILQHTPKYIFFQVFLI
ncbi:HYC_CC_PP family protein [Lunatibacter salilacus]|uniref:HYC_CC_PP family protein n=1 Tax=Lunatibacter salilacus TaxID=2483804 RepID=UPI00131E2C56|nr:hypothetical protein [Lunatibacter salilacus]